MLAKYRGTLFICIEHYPFIWAKFHARFHLPAPSITKVLEYVEKVEGGKNMSTCLTSTWGINNHANQ